MHDITTRSIVAASSANDALTRTLHRAADAISDIGRTDLSAAVERLKAEAALFQERIDDARSEAAGVLAELLGFSGRFEDMLAGPIPSLEDTLAAEAERDALLGVAAPSPPIPSDEELEAMSCGVCGGTGFTGQVGFSPDCDTCRGTGRVTQSAVVAPSEPLTYVGSEDGPELPPLPEAPVNRIAEHLSESVAAQPEPSANGKHGGRRRKPRT